ncbi:MAG: protein translocase subunit SecD [Pseudomonadota bacterium]
MIPKTIRNSLVFLAIVTAAALILALGGLKSIVPWRSAGILPGEGLRLGLDLQGGLHLLLKVNLPRAVQHQLEAAVAEAVRTLRANQIAVKTRPTTAANRIRLGFRDADQAEAARSILRKNFPFLFIHAENQQPNNADLELALMDSEVRSIETRAVEQCLEIIRNRIDQFGVAEPLLVQQGRDQIVVQLPGLQDPQRALELIGKTAQLEFKLVDDQATADLSAWIPEAIRSGLLKEGFNHHELNQAMKDQLPSGDTVYMEKRLDRETGRVVTRPILVHQAALMTGDALRTAQVQISGDFNEPYVSLTFNDRGARLFERITTENVGRRLAIILDDVVKSAPVIREPISGGKAQITGAFTTEEASDLAIVLRAGSLPAPVDIVQNLTVGPSLGRDSIQKGIDSAILGTALVVGFMVALYRISGVIANGALLLNLVFMVAAMSLFRATLTLPGLAGIVLSIGMAVDTNVLIFERMREELALKQPLRSAIESGYAKALWTIVDSHVTTLITALALFLFGTGPIKGFAVTLSLGIVFNLFTALYATKIVYGYLTFNRRLKGLRFLRLIGKPNIDFIGWRKAAFAFSAILVGLGLLAVVQIQRGHANLGVDLSGGTMAQFRARQDFRLEDVRAALVSHNLSGCELQEVPKEHLLIVRVKQPDQTVSKVVDQIATVLASDFPQQHFTLESSAAVGASVSRDLKRAALIAISISLVGFILYLAWRFDRRYGVAAAVATFHDVLAVLGLFYLLNKEITLLVITALLTLAGYSLTDTVVVFDRIRENMAKQKRQDLGAVINGSINEVLSRTIITSVTVLLVLAALLCLGGELLRDFALALTVGVVVGTYSSIFVASPIVYIWPASRKVLQKIGRPHKTVSTRTG